MASSTDKHEAFTQWATDRGVQITGVKAAQLPGRGIGLVATKPIKKDERILFTPEKAMFKPDMAMLRSGGLVTASPQAHLAVSAMLAFQPQGSALRTWSSTWPDQDSFEQGMPMCWPEPLRKLLPPSAEHPLARQLADFDKDWKAVGKVCTKQGYNQEMFKYYWMIVNSRSFHWKPLAGKAGSMVMCPFIDYMNHRPTGNGCKVYQSASGYEVVAERDYEAGEEVLATYGGHSNDKLLVHYGFICSSPPDKPNPDDEVRLDHIIIPHLPQSVRDQLQDVGFLGGYVLSPATNEICFKTEVAIRAALLTANEWEYFVSTGEDLADDQSAKVQEYVKGLLIGYRGDVVRKIQEAGERGDSQAYAKHLLKMRWQQILDVIDAYVQQQKA